MKIFECDYRGCTEDFEDNKGVNRGFLGCERGCTEDIEDKT